MNFVFQIGDDAEQRRDVVHTRITIGRAVTCDVVVDRDGVAPDHCHVVRRNGEWFVEDRQSQGGTAVLRGGGQPELVLGRAQPLAVGDVIMIGHHTRPRFRGHLELPSLEADRVDGGELSSLTTPASASATPDATPLPLGDAALRHEVTRLRAALAAVEGERDALAQAAAETRGELDLVRRDEARATASANRLLAEQAAELDSLARRIDQQKQELARLGEALRAERLDHQATRRLRQTDESELANMALLAQQRAEVIERMSGDLAMIRSQLAEQTQLADNLTAENLRLHARLGN